MRNTKGALAISLGLSYLAASLGSFGPFNGIQLTLHTIWNPGFFGAKLLLPGFILAVALALSVFVTR